MEPVRVEQIEVDRCSGCAGMWFDMREHEHLKRITGSEGIDTGRAPATKAGDASSRANCPRCNTPMIEMAFPEQPHIRYEMCSTCYGLFLDAGEFKDFKQTTLAERVRYAFGHLFK